MSAVINAFSLGLGLGQTILKFATAKYIESAGSATGAMASRAQAVKALASSLDGVALGTTSVADFVNSTAAQLEAKQVSKSSQILVTGLLSEVTGVLPALPTGNWISAAGGAIADTFLKDVIAVANEYTAS